MKKEDVVDYVKLYWLDNVMIYQVVLAPRCLMRLMLVKTHGVAWYALRVAPNQNPPIVYVAYVVL